jgi:carbohydrate binding protein with CBM4/9 domain
MKTAILLILLAQDPRQALRVAEQSASENKYDEALSAAGDAERAAVKAQDPALALAARDKKRELALLKREYEKVRPADQRLSSDPSDAAASDAMGRFYCFVKGDWSKGMALLSKSEDAFLKGLSDKEASGGALAAGDAWWTGYAEVEVKGGLTGATATATVKADKELLARVRYTMLQRAAHWYSQAWPALRADEKERVRKRLREFYANPKPGPARPVDGARPWTLTAGDVKGVELSDVYARSGRQSLRVGGQPKSTAPVQVMEYKAPVPLVPGKKYEISAWFLSEGEASLQVGCAMSENGNWIGTGFVEASPDQPYWQRATREFTVPDKANVFKINMVVTGKTGQVFVDDVSIHAKDEERELVQNGSFER